MIPIEHIFLQRETRAVFFLPVKKTTADGSFPSFSTAAASTAAPSDADAEVERKKSKDNDWTLNEASVQVNLQNGNYLYEYSKC